MKEKKIRSKKKGVIIAVGSVVGIIALIAIVGYVYIHSLLGKMNYIKDDTIEIDTTISLEDELNASGEDVSADELNSIEGELGQFDENEIFNNENVYNVLVIGSDRRDTSSRGRTDVMMIVTLNKETKKIVMTSLLRDIYVSIPGMQSNRLNAAYAYGGAPLLISTIKQNFGFQLDDYVIFDFYSFIKVIDSIGGITLTMTEEEIKIANNYIGEINGLTNAPANDGYLTKAGTYVVSGKQALGYARNRYVGHGDFARTQRQRIVMEAVFEKAKTLSVPQLNTLMNTLLPEVTTNIPINKMIGLLFQAPTYLGYEIESWSVPMLNTYKGVNIRGMAVLNIDFSTNIKEMKSRLYGITQ